MDYRSMVNPTYVTAKGTLFMLAGAENEDAKRFIDALGAQDDLRQSVQRSNGGTSPLSEEDMNAMAAGSSVAVEARYEALSRLLRTGAYANLLDIACGYTPRSLFCAREGIGYVGIDVPVVAEELQQMFERVGIKTERPTYVGGDATNAASLKAAADLLQGRVLISCEGLTQYLSADEFEQFLGGIRQILVEHGGVWVTSDMGVSYEAFGAACLSSPDAIETYRAARKLAMGATNVYANGVALWSADEKQSLIERNGFRVEKAPFYHDDEHLVALERLPEPWQKTLRKELNASRLWIMSVDDSHQQTQTIEGASKVENLSITYAKRKGILHCKVSGRIDTISAPALLEVLDNNSDGVRELRVDAKDLQYISSAGLRVLMMALKKLGEGSVLVFNASAAIKEIFETTGFDQMIRVE